MTRPGSRTVVPPMLAEVPPEPGSVDVVPPVPIGVPSGVVAPPALALELEPEPGCPFGAPAFPEQARADSATAGHKIRV